MAKIFVSHSTEDRYFVNLLVALLEFHGLETCCSLSHLQAGTQSRKEIESALRDADFLIVITSQNTIKSRSVTKGVAFFQAHKPDSQILPLHLDSTNLDDVVDGLKNHHAIDFTQCMLTGFEELLSLFGKEFLPHFARIQNKRQPDRRSDADRRESVDRRDSILIRRLRVGFWSAYSQSTGMGKFDDLTMGMNNLFKVIDSLQVEVSKYEYVNTTGVPCDCREVLEKSTHNVWEIMRDKERTAKAVYVIDAIVEDISRNYEVKPTSRRGSGRRSESDDRRRNDNSTVESTE